MRHLFCIAILLIFSSNLYATSCFPDGVSFNNGNAVLSGLETCDTIGGDLILAGNFVNPFSTAVPLTTVLGDVRVLKSTQFTLNNAFENLTYIGGDLQISFSAAPFILNTFSQVEQIGGDLIIQGNSGVLLFDFLNSLQYIGGKIIFEGNDNMTAISGLQALTQMNGVIILDDNPQLQSIFGLRNIDPAGIDNLTITNCPQLSICQLNNFCDYLTNNGVHTLSNNAIGCNLTSEITAGCIPLNCPTDDLIYSTAIDDLNYKIIYKNCTTVDHDIFYAFTEPTAITFRADGFSNYIEAINGNINMANEQSFLYNLGFNNLLNLNGNLSISSTASLFSLLGFSSLEVINGDFLLENIESFFPFQSLSFGFNNLHTIEGNFEYRNNPILEPLPPFESLTTINGDLIFDSNGIQELDLILNLTNVGGEIIISNNGFLNNITAFINVDPQSFSNLVIQNNPFLSFCDLPNFCEYLNQNNPATIEGNSASCGSVEIVENACAAPADCQIGSITITNQPDLNSYLAQFGSCNKINGNLTISGVDNLIPFQNVDTIVGSMTIANVNLTDLNDFQNLKHIGGSLIITGNLGTENLEGFENLKQIGVNLEVTGSSMVDMTNDLPAVETIGGDILFDINNSLTHTPLFQSMLSPINDFRCTENVSLETIQGLNNITTIGGNVFIQLNDSLTTLNAFQNLTSINGSFQLKTHPFLTDFSGFESIQSIGSFTTLFDNESLNTIPFSNLETIGGTLLISKNGFTDLSGLQNLVTIDGDIEITNNQMLTNTADLNNLTSIDGYLAVFNNNLLTSLNGLHNIDPTSINNMYLYGSDLLSDCAVQSICDYLSDPSNPSSINTNASGCLTEVEILEACTTSTSDVEFGHNISVFPNPTNGFIQINGINQTYTIRLINTFGQHVFEILNNNTNTIDLSKIASGIYFLHIQNQHTNYSEKIIIK